MLRWALGLEQPPPARRPRYFQFPTLETQLPTRFSAVKAELSDLVSQVRDRKREGKPDLVCKYCPALKSFGGVIALWRHYVHKHDNISSDERLAEVKHTAALWSDYWVECKDGGKRNLPTEAKLRQVEQEGFRWDDVLAWDLR